MVKLQIRLAIPACLSLGLAAAGAAQAAELPPYADAIRCAGLLEATMVINGKGAPDEAKRFDQALFWGLAASERARKDGLAAPTFKKDQEDARAKAEAELRAGSEAAAKERDDCAAKVPPL